MPVKNTFIVFLTGNNLVIEGDAVRRILVIRIDPDVARPERERHTFDPVDYVKEHRADLVHDCLLILRAYFLAGRPEQNGHEIGSFERVVAHRARCPDVAGPARRRRIDRPQPGQQHA